MVLVIKRTQTSGRGNVSRCIILLTIVYLERFSLIGERVKPMEKRSLPRIGEWSLEKIRERVNRLKDLGLLYGKDVEMVDALGCPEELALVAMHKRLELIDHGMTKIGDDMKGLRKEVAGKLKYVEDNKRMMMEEMFKRLESFGNKFCGKSKVDDKDVEVEIGVGGNGRTHEAIGVACQCKTIMWGGFL
ncbi:hypothetical protein M9H77_35061 [Catharanthus roseus]|uniref:Uncharacterized protein n=1 Tax=Catharanthus roseus TaxID=4058 RepID=A0ACB9ZMX8_CATRO|nr:hypothetical protein M9H77_35061 [Catharanthus roseus]